MSMCYEWLSCGGPCRIMAFFDFVFFFNDTATTEIYTLSLHDALPIYEIVRVNSQGGTFKVITRPNLHNKKGTSSFQNAMRLKKDGIFMSPLNLNLENNKIENKGTNKNPEYVPVIRYATPLFDNFGNSKGIILISIYANHFLKKIQENHLNGREVFLLNGKGFYLSNKNKSKEFEFMFNKKSSFFKDYPEKITTALLANKGQTFLEIGRAHV